MDEWIVGFALTLTLSHPMGEGTAVGCVRIYGYKLAARYRRVDPPVLCKTMELAAVLRLLIGGHGRIVAKWTGKIFYARLNSAV